MSVKVAWTVETSTCTVEQEWDQGWCRLRWLWRRANLSLCLSEREMGELLQAVAAGREWRHPHATLRRDGGRWVCATQHGILPLPAGAMEALLPRSPLVPRADVLAHLRRHNISIPALARAAGVSATTTYRVLRGLESHPPLQALLGELLREVPHG